MVYDKTGSSYSSLIRSLFFNSGEDVETILKTGSDPNEDLNGAPILTLACADNLENEVELLLQYGADPNRQSEYELTPLQSAAANYSLPIFKLLIQHGATPTVDDQGQNILHYIVQTGFPDFCKYGISQFAHLINTTDKSNRTPLCSMVAEFYGDISAEDDFIKIAKLLIASDANCSITDIYGNAAKDYAEKLSMLKLVPVLS